MNRPLLFALLAGLAVLAGLVLDRTRMAPEASAAGSTPADVSESRAEKPAPPSDPTALAATAGEYRPDAPRRRDELGRPLPFREQPLAVDIADLLRSAQTGNFIVLELFPGIALRARVTGRWVDGGETRVAAQFDGRPADDRLFGSWHQDGMRALVELPSENLAYEIIDDGKGGYVVREWLFTDVVCATPSADGRAASGGLPLPADPAASAPTQQAAAIVPLLSSRPGAAAVIYLDFDGETVSGTAWDGGNTIVAPPAALNESQIREVFERVQRDFEMFAVNVTTDRSAYDRAPANARTHCIVTANDQARPGAGGVAYTGSFGETSSARKICWAFLDTRAKSTAEVVSHEVGHTLGLGHDGRSATGGLPREEYYEGHGSGATGWAPIMGVGYYQQLTQWSKGEYARANNPQDDTAIMAAYVPLLGDDAGGTRERAVNVAGDRVAGMLEQPADRDFFRVELPAGEHSIFLEPAAHGNTDLELQVENDAGAVLAKSNPADELAASVSFTLGSPQTVFLRVDGVGKSDPLGTGYTDYASLGLFYLYGFGNQQLPPSAPIGLSTQRISGTQTRLTWTPNLSATSYRVFRNGILLGTVAVPEFLDAEAQPATGYVYTVSASNAFGTSAESSGSAVTTPAFDEFIMDGAPDFSGYLVSENGMTIYAAVRGTKLYVATWSPGHDFSGFGSDHHLFVSDTLLGSATTPAPWAKSGFLAIPGSKPYLAGEYTSTFAGWFNTGGTATHFKSPLNSGVMEGVIDLAAEFGAVPENVYVAAVAYGNDDGAGISSQAPRGNGNDNLEPEEFLRIPVKGVADRKLNGTYDVLDAARGFAVSQASFDNRGRPVLRWPVVPGKSYQIQSRTALDTGGWQNLLATPWTADVAQWEMEFTDANAPASGSFYRVTRP